MIEREADIVRKLLRENEAFRRMKERHAELENQLQNLETKPYLTPQDEVEIRKIKKRKLLFKDEMQRIVAAHRAAR
jgi:uncharacterized protein YdcH (DUF465 family)